jgi:hypothetical protein
MSFKHLDSSNPLYSSNSSSSYSASSSLPAAATVSSNKPRSAGSDRSVGRSFSHYHLLPNLLQVLQSQRTAVVGLQTRSSSSSSTSICNACECSISKTDSNLHLRPTVSALLHHLDQDLILCEVGKIRGPLRRTLHRGLQICFSCA